MAREKFLWEWVLREGLKHLHTKKGETTFKATQDAFILSQPKATWIERRLPRWQASLEDQGFDVDSIELVPPGASSSGNYYEVYEGAKSTGKIVLTLTISGSVDLSGFHPAIAKGLSGLIKKALALETLFRFPPPFDPMKPLVASGSKDYLIIEGRADVYLWKTEEREAFVLNLQTLVEESGAKIVHLYLPHCLHDYRVDINWSKDVSDESRHRLTEAIEEMILAKLEYRPRVYFIIR